MSATDTIVLYSAALFTIGALIICLALVLGFVYLVVAIVTEGIGDWK